MTEQLRPVDTDYAADLAARIKPHQMQIDLLTQGGPLKKTNVIVYAMYDAVFRQNNEGKAAVLSVALFVITLILTVIQLRLLERRVTYER